jgi:hypothetical protein
MLYSDMPVIIPLLATAYLLTIYLLLMLARRTLKSSQYMTNSLTDAYAPYIQPEPVTQTDEVERWSLRLRTVAPLRKREWNAVASNELPPTATQPKKGQESKALY